jgi:hypothetical protein
MKYSVPQFIDVEDKIFGPFTFRQFAYLIGGGGLCYIILKLLPTIFAFMLIVPIGGLAGALAFVKVNGKPLIEMLQSGVNFYIKKKLYLWKKDENRKVEKKEEVEVKKTPLLRISESKLHDISWGLDVLTKDSTGSSEK